MAALPLMVFRNILYWVYMKDSASFASYDHLSQVATTSLHSADIAKSDFFISSDDTSFSLPAYHSDLYWIEQITRNIDNINPHAYPLDYYFRSFADLLQNRTFEPESGLFDIVKGLHYTRNDFRYSGYIECLLGVIDDLKLEIDTVNRRVSSSTLGNQSLVLWDVLIKEVWLRTKSQVFIQRCDQRKRRAARRKVLMESYVLKVLEKYKRLLVLRVDFGYLKEYAPSVSEQEARADLARLFANRRHNKGLLPDLMGYVCCVEWAEETRYHFHALFMLDGDRRWSDVHLAQQVGQYWADVITKGRGRFYNCNLSKHLYRSCGIGMIHQKNAEEVTSLVKDALGYLLDKDQYLIAKTLEHSKTVFRGVMP